MNGKNFEFKGSAGGYFVASIVSLITAYIPIVGWPVGFNYYASWIADNALVNGRKVKYSAAYVETLVFLLINVLLLIITLGLYGFWFVPKSFKFIAEHVSYVDETSAPAAAPAAPATPVAPSTPTMA